MNPDSAVSDAGHEGQAFSRAANGSHMNFVRSSRSKRSIRSSPHLFPPPRRGGGSRRGIERLEHWNDLNGSEATS
jgi:hypothetical protein